jgi:hypothetical protein
MESNDQIGGIPEMREEQGMQMEMPMEGQPQ